MSDPVDWNRREILGHKTLWNRVRELIMLRTWHPALQRNEVNLSYTHPKLNENNGPRVFAYCRTAGKDLGKDGQVVVVANTGPGQFPDLQPALDVDNSAQPNRVRPPSRSPEPATLSINPRALTRPIPGKSIHYELGNSPLWTIRLPMDVLAFQNLKRLRT